MNIFEQFGIKEVADVILYAIDLDKYDDEIYIPVLYLDALKISSLEQSASQTAARGGVGNPELIVWDFGKEITASLQDALFSPASQSLMWGGQYGIQKPRIYGVWDPYVYPTDSTGRPIYYEKIQLDPNAVQEVVGGWDLYVGDITIATAQTCHFYPTYFEDIYASQPMVAPWFLEYLVINNITAQTVTYGGEDYDGFIMSCYNNHPTTPSSVSVICFPADGRLMLYFSLDDWATSVALSGEIPLLNFVCPCDGEEKYFFFKQAQGHYLYNKDGEGLTDPMVVTDYQCPSDNVINESEEIQRSVGKYTIADNELNNKGAWYNAERPEMAYITVDKFGYFTYQVYEFVSREGDDVCYYHDVDLCDEALIKCTDEKIDAYGYTWEDTSIIMSSLEKNQETHYLDSVDLRYRIRQDNGTREIAIEYHSDNDNNFKPKIDIYRNITQKYKDSRGFEQKEIIKVLIGSFYIIDDWNLTSTTPQEFAYMIDNGLHDVKKLEKVDKITAKRTFAIDADKNLRSSNYRYDSRYDDMPLTVFLNPRTMQPYEPNSSSYITKDGQYIEGNLTIIKAGDTYYKWTRTLCDEYSSLGSQIIVDAKHFPGAFKLVGQTYARSSYDGNDTHYQFELPLCKLAADTNISLEAAGDPTTFSMNFKVLQKDDGTMMKLTMYDVSVNPETGTSEVIPTTRISNESSTPEWTETTVQRVIGDYRAVLKNTSYELVNPTDNTVQFTDSEADAPLDGTAEGEFHNATHEELAAIIEDPDAVIRYGENVVLPDQQLKNTANNYFSLHMDTIVVKEVKLYDIEQESHLVDSNGHIVPGSEIWTTYLTNVPSTKYLESNEYTYRNNFVVLGTQEVGE